MNLNAQTNFYSGQKITTSAKKSNSKKHRVIETFYVLQNSSCQTLQVIKKFPKKIISAASLSQMHQKKERSITNLSSLKERLFNLVKKKNNRMHFLDYYTRNQDRAILGRKKQLRECQWPTKQIGNFAMQKMKWRSNVEYAMGSWGRPLKYGNLNLFFFEKATGGQRPTWTEIHFSKQQQGEQLKLWPAFCSTKVKSCDSPEN